ncbi:unnamed protein product [Discosporangium mesarthrocarpum]
MGSSWTFFGCIEAPCHLRMVLTAVGGFFLSMIYYSHAEEGVTFRVSPPRMCTVEEILPFPGRGEWKDAPVGTPSFNCSCPHYKGRYFCPHAEEFLKVWETVAVNNTGCTVIDRSSLAENPLPPFTTVLFVGNSHMRQTVESILCLAAESVREREMMLFFGDNKPQRRHSVTPMSQCRGGPLEPGCNAELGRTDQCNDDVVSVVFENHASIKYIFADNERAKSIGKYAEVAFGMKPSDFDVVVANPGNMPYMTRESLVSTARALNGTGTALFWMSTYDGTYLWEDQQESPLKGLDVVQFDTHNIVSSQTSYQVQNVEMGHVNDPHFCLPGPPLELGVLLLDLIWARTHQQGVK